MYPSSLPLAAVGLQIQNIKFVWGNLGLHRAICKTYGALQIAQTDL